MTCYYFLIILRNLTNEILEPRALSPGIFGIILLVAACIGGLGFGGYKYYAKVKRAKEFPSLEGTINDPAAGTGADFAYVRPSPLCSASSLL